MAAAMIVTGAVLLIGGAAWISAPFALMVAGVLALAVGVDLGRRP